MNRKFARPLTMAIAVATLAVAGTALSSSATQQGTRNGNLQIAQYQHVVITGQDMRNLPSGESRISRNDGGTGGTAATKSANVYTITFGGSLNQSQPLTKVGTGHLILPNTYGGVTDIKEGAQNSAKSGYGVTKVGPGTLANKDQNNSTTKEGRGILILTSDNSGAVYEFRNLTAAEFERVMVPTSNGNLKIKNFVERTRPAAEMKGWPFPRLVIGPAEGVVEVQGWGPGAITSGKPDPRNACGSSFCACYGSGCLKLKAVCNSGLSCGPFGHVCWCGK